MPAARASAGLRAHGSVLARLAYPFAHASVLHAVLNCWCLLSLAFIAGISFWQLLVAYVIAISYPSVFLSSVPVVGFSGVCFALLGMVALSVRRKLYYQFWVWLMLVLGWFFPNAAAGLHLWCYLWGMAVAVFTTPMGAIKEGWHEF